ncbi:hypothetical protein ACJJTC_006477 [Scirpophaga incertulas]
MKKMTKTVEGSDSVCPSHGKIKKPGVYTDGLTGQKCQWHEEETPSRVDVLWKKTTSLCARDLKKTRCFMCSQRKMDTRTISKCIQCQVNLCIEGCFKDFHKRI